MKIRVIITVLTIILSGCLSLQKKTMTFIGDDLGFYIKQKDQKNKFKRKDSIVYQKNDTITICKNYKNLHFYYRFRNSDIKQYYYVNDNKKNLIDHVLLEYYQKNLTLVELISEGKEKLMPLVSITEDFFQKKIRWDDYDSSKTRTVGQIMRKNWLSAIIIYYPKDEEILISITTSDVRNPYVCGNSIKNYNKNYWKNREDK